MGLITPPKPPLRPIPLPLELLTHCNLTYKGPGAAAPNQALPLQRPGGWWLGDGSPGPLGRACLELVGTVHPLTVRKQLKGKRWHLWAWALGVGYLGL